MEATMGWAEKKAREIADMDDPNEPGMCLGTKVAAIVEQAIRETIEKCAEVADESLSEVEAAIAGRVIRRLGEP